MEFLARISRASVCFIGPLFLFYLVPRIVVFSERILQSFGQFYLSSTYTYSLGWLILFYLAKLSYKFTEIKASRFSAETQIIGISATFILATSIMGMILMTLLILSQ